MKEKCNKTKADERKQIIPKNIRYTYFGSLVEIDGIGYPVVAAIPFRRAIFEFPTATEKLLKLVEGK